MNAVLQSFYALRGCFGSEVHRKHYSKLSNIYKPPSKANGMQGRSALPQDYTTNTSRRRRLFSIIKGLAGVLWATLVIGASIAVLIRPSRSIFDVYRAAVSHWWAAEPVYGTGMRAFVYLTASPLVFTPFTWLGRPFDDLAWRLFSVGLFGYGLWRLVGLVRRNNASLAFAVLVLLLIPCAGVDVQRGQATVAMVGWVFLGAVAAAEQRWNWAIIWFCVAVALKPLALVPLALFFVVFKPMRLKFALGLCAVFTIPFVHQDPGYVFEQTLQMVYTLSHAGSLGITRFNDIAMMLDRFGYDLSENVLLIVRGGAAILVLAIAVIGTRDKGPRTSAISCLSLGMVYLMLFNPRTELGSYFGMAAVIGLFMVREGEKSPVERGLLGLIILGMGTQAYGDWIFRPTDVWLKPALCALFSLWLAFAILRPRWKSHRASLLFEKGQHLPNLL